MLNRIIAAGRLRPAALHDANIPALVVGETRSVSVCDVTLQAGLFVSLVLLPLILIIGAWEAPAGAAVMWLAFRAVRRSSFRYQRLRRS